MLVRGPDPTSGIDLTGLLPFPSGRDGGVSLNSEQVPNDCCLLPCLNRGPHAGASPVASTWGEGGAESPAERPTHPPNLQAVKERAGFWTVLKAVFLDPIEIVTCQVAGNKELGLWRVWQVGSFACWCHRNGHKIITAYLCLQRGVCLLIVSGPLDVSGCWPGMSSHEKWRGYSYKAPVSCSAFKSRGFLRICIL